MLAKDTHLGVFRFPWAATCPGSQSQTGSKAITNSLPECLEEVTCTWSTPFSPKNPVQGGSVLDCVDMVGIGLAHMPPIEPLVSSHLHPIQKSYMTSTGPTLPHK